MSGIIDMSKADEKDASLKMKLKTDSGFNSSTEGDRVSANQWGDIIAITQDGDRYRVMKAAPEMLAALEAVQKLHAYSGDDVEGFAAHVDGLINAAIAKAVGA